MRNTLITGLTLLCLGGTIFHAVTMESIDKSVTARQIQKPDIKPTPKRQRVAPTYINYVNSNTTVITTYILTYTLTCGRSVIGAGTFKSLIDEAAKELDKPVEEVRINITTAAALAAKEYKSSSRLQDVYCAEMTDLFVTLGLLQDDG